jgi:hypothetical protein
VLQHNCFRAGEPSVVVVLAIQGFASASFAFYKESVGTNHLTPSSLPLRLSHQTRTGVLCDPAIVGTTAQGTDVVSGGQAVLGWQYGTPLQEVSPLLAGIGFWAQTIDGAPMPLSGPPTVTCTCAVPMSLFVCPILR